MSPTHPAPTAPFAETTMPTPTTVTTRPEWTLPATSARHARERPEHPAIVCERRIVTYADVHEASNRVAHALRTAGVQAGTRIAYLGRESEYYYIVVLGCAKVGAVLVPVNWRLTSAEVDHILRDSGARVLFADSAFAGTIERVRPGLPGLVSVVLVDGPRTADPGQGLRTWWADAPSGELNPSSSPDGPVVQIYTSGTTGRPKGAVVAHRSFFTLPAALRAAGVSWLDWLPDDISLISLPGLGTAGMGWFMHGFNAGLTNVVMRTFVPQQAVRLIRELGVTTTFAAPAMLRMMLDEQDADRAAFASMRKIAYGGAPISSALLTRCMAVFDCEFAQIYASTETASVATCLPPSAHRPGSPLLGSAGLVCPGNEIKIIDERGRTLPPGQTGQICVRTPARMLGYWGMVEETDRTLRDGWLLMGDLGHLDENGCLYLADRINDTIIVAGQNIYPAEVERELGEHPEVVDAAVVGVADERWGEAVHAFVVLAPGASPTPRQLLVFLRARLADYKLPVAFHVVEELPRNPAGKLLRRVLRAGVSAGGTP